MADDVRVKIFTVATVPPDLAQAWLQHLRDFDTKHPGCHFEVKADALSITTAQAVEILKVHPELSFTDIIERGVKWDKEPGA